MTELHLDYQPNSSFPWIGAALLGMVLIALLFSGAYFYKLNGQIATLEARIEQTKIKGTQRASGRGSADRGSAEQAQEVTNANDALHHLIVPWDSLFQAVESSGNRNITLLAIEPDFEKQQVKISGEAKDFSSLMKYITHLQEQVVFGSVYLQNHDIQQDDPDKAVRFSLLADWRDKS